MFQVTTSTLIAFLSFTGGGGALAVLDKPLNVLNPLSPASLENIVLSLRKTVWCSESPRAGDTGDAGETCI